MKGYQITNEVLQQMQQEILELSKMVDKTNTELNKTAKVVSTTNIELGKISKVVERIDIALNGEGMYSDGLILDVKKNKEYLAKLKIHELPRKIQELEKKVSVVSNHYEDWEEEGRWESLKSVVKNKEVEDSLKTRVGVSSVASGIGFLISVATLLKLFGVF